jgi:transposase InsO family protein
VKYACIARHCREWPVRLMCECLGVSRAGFYAARRRQLSPRGRQNQQLTLEIRAVHAASRRRYGAPKVYHELRAQGIECGHNRVARLMRLDGLRAKRSRPFRVTTDSTHTQPRQPNRLGRRFAVPICTRSTGGCISRPSWISPPAGSSAGRPIARRTNRSRFARWRWHCAIDGRGPGCYTTLTKASNTRVERIRHSSGLTA